MQRNRVVYDTAIGRTDRCSFCKRRLEACVCPDHQPGGRASGDGVVRIWLDRKGRRGKSVTVIKGLPANAALLDQVAASLKKLCGSGGTVADGNVEIQGDHRDRIATRLTELGYRVKLAGG